MVLVVRSGGAAAAAALRGAPGAASRGFFLFWPGPLGAAAAGERRGAGVWPGLAARDGKK